MSSSDGKPILVWLRNTFRLHDNEPLFRASQLGRPVIPVMILDPDDPMGAASRWWLHHSLVAFEQSLRVLGSRLILRRGDPLAVLHALMDETGADTVYCNARYEPSERLLTEQLIQDGHAKSFECQVFQTQLLSVPGTINNKSGQPYKVFTPYWRAVQEVLPFITTYPVVMSLQVPTAWPATEAIESWGLLPSIPWDQSFYAHWQPGETGARQQLAIFLNDVVAQYQTGRDQPGVSGTSRLSPHLHFGEISVREVMQAVNAIQSNTPQVASHTQCYLSELAWRDFAHHLLFHFPQMVDEPLNDKFRAFDWADADSASEWLTRWQQGQTGYPIVDAGMRELWQTGWMHNRVRIIVGSFLVKHLKIHWREGAQWFWDTLVDADLASNTMGWQWIAGCGADAAPYFRIFNPMLQGQKFDSAGAYVRRWIPELSGLSASTIHEPWKLYAAKPLELVSKGVVLGETYPFPVVDHAEAREKALAAYKRLSQ